jgi:hypothetical protein
MSAMFWVLGQKNPFWSDEERAAKIVDKQVTVAG